MAKNEIKVTAMVVKTAQHRLSVEREGDFVMAYKDGDLYERNGKLLYVSATEMESGELDKYWTERIKNGGIKRG